MAAAEMFKPLLGRAAQGETLSAAEAEQAFDLIMSGELPAAAIGAFLTALKMRGETVEEIVAAAATLRQRMVGVAAPIDAIDNCGTGGDGSGTWNVSTGAAFVIAGAGVPVAKHGNRAISSRSGSSQVLEALGVRLDVGPATIEKAIAEAGIGFMFAPNHHPAMKAVAQVRVDLGFRTIFNLVGPLANPASTRRQLLGVPSHTWLETFATALARLGAEKAWVVHGAGGLDEMSTLGETEIAVVDGARVTRLTVTPEEVGLSRATAADLKGGDPATNAAKIEAMLAGELGPYRDIVLLNAAAALVVAGRARDLSEGVTAAERSIDSGAARAALDRLVGITRAA